MRTFAERFRDLRYQVFYGALSRTDFPLEALGNSHTGCRWTFSPEGLDRNSVVYTAGIGRDISFEKELAERFDCKITMLDPSPTGRETMGLAENQDPRFTFEPVALAGKQGTLRLAPPINSAEGSWFMREGAEGTLEVPCVELQSLMRRDGHSHVDLLKIDIEGAEYEVLEQLLRARLDVRQILVEYHHGLVPGIRRIQTVRSILSMIFKGYDLLKQEGLNHTFKLRTHRTIRSQ